MKTIRPWWIAGLAAFAAMAATEANGTPRYSMRVGQDCNLCHHNPTGGGLRDPYASQYLLPERLAMRRERSEDAGPNPQIGDDVVIGADLRTFYLDRDDLSFGNHFLEMQGSLYLSLRMADPRFSAYVHQEFGQNFGEAFEVYGMAYVLPATGYVKIGKLVPAFGWKVPDHRAFARREFVFLPSFPPHSDNGIEVGLYPASFTLETSLLNGEFRSPRDTNDDFAFAGRGSWRYLHGPLHVVVGGSYYWRGGTTENRRAGGPLGALRWGPFVWLGEFDWTRRETFATPGGPPDVARGFTTSHEVSWSLVQGLDLVATYDFHDPDTDLESGVAHRIGFGIESLVYPFLQVTGKVNVFVVDEGPDTEGLVSPGDEDDFDDEDFLQFQLQVHYLY